jgi:hypothetical protein
MRVMNVELGALDSNMVKLTVVEDVFALSSAVYAPPPPSGWVSPNSDPAACPYHLVMEAPYWDMVQLVGEVEAESIGATQGAVVATGVRPSSDASNAQLHFDQGAGYGQVGVVDFCPTAALSASVTIDATTFPISGGVDLDIVRIGSYAHLNGELVSVVSLSSTTMTVGRGVLDTVPVAHSSGSRVLFSDGYADVVEVEYALNETARVKLLPATSKGVLPIGSAPEQTVVIKGRAAKPYPPGKVRVASVANPASCAETVSVTWAHRDRLQQTSPTLVNHEAGSIGPEINTRYALRLTRMSDSAVVAFKNDIGGTSASFSLKDAGQVKLELWSISSKGESLQKHVRLFDYTPTVGATTDVITASTYVYEDEGVIFDGGGA